MLFNSGKVFFSIYVLTDPSSTALFRHLSIFSLCSFGWETGEWPQVLPDETSWWRPQDPIYRGTTSPARWVTLVRLEAAQTTWTGSGESQTSVVGLEERIQWASSLLYVRSSVRCPACPRPASASSEQMLVYCGLEHQDQPWPEHTSSSFVLWRSKSVGSSKLCWPFLWVSGPLELWGICQCPVLDRSPPVHRDRKKNPESSGCLVLLPHGKTPKHKHIRPETMPA